MLSERTVAIVKQITPAVAPRAEDITRNFYARMFQENPEVREFFNPSHQFTGRQQQALAASICAYFTHIDDLPALGPAVELIAHKHCSLGVRAEHYPIVGRHLLAAIADVLGDAVTPEIADAVVEAYQTLAEICIEREQQIYASQRNRPGGWNGLRPLRVEAKVRESDVITSFYLRPRDAQPLPTFVPGQYVTVWAPTETGKTPRNYSLSDRPGTGYFRISVKREGPLAAGAPDGVVSHYLHDHVQVGDVIDVGPPCGEFSLNPTQVGSQPIVLLAGGVGVTPLLAMLKALVHEQVGAPLYFLQAARNSQHQAFAAEVRQLAGETAQLRTLTLYDEPLPGDVEEGRCERVGRIDAETLRSWAPWREAECYVCGPPPFLAAALASLAQLGVPAARRHYEFFGPLQALAPVLAETP